MTGHKPLDCFDPHLFYYKQQQKKRLGTTILECVTEDRQLVEHAASQQILVACNIDFLLKK